MSRKPNPESVAKVLAAGIVPGCKVRDFCGDEGDVLPVEQWTGSPNPRYPNNVFSGTLMLYCAYAKKILATIIEPAPALPDNFNTQAHSHLVTERFPVDDEHMDTLYLEYRHDQAEIQRDALIGFLKENGISATPHLSDKLYDYFYKKATP
jgi:hypothetical protein